MSLSVNGNNYHAYGTQEPKKNTAKKVAVAAGAAAAFGTGIYLVRSGKGSEIASKLRKNLEAFAIGKKILGITDRVSAAISGVKEKIVNKAGELKITEKAQTVKTAIKESPAYKKAGEIKTKAQEKIKDLHLSEKASDIKTTVKDKAKDLHIKEKASELIEKFKGLFKKSV